MDNIKHGVYKVTHAANGNVVIVFHHADGEQRIMEMTPREATELGCELIYESNQAVKREARLRAGAGRDS